MECKHELNQCHPNELKERKTVSHLWPLFYRITRSMLSRKKMVKRGIVGGLILGVPEPFSASVISLAE